ncbi:DNA damage inducible 1 homolog rngo isoform X4 [Lycorma delicatula]|uniref:DNA damage inducible 1 homolog rngo isoform X4 n=1 Tax=Lycorma delicatula TaxID=130591 RepID=UPI003F51A694
MKVTVSTLSDELFVLDVSEDLELENFKAFCEVESGFPAPEIVIVHNGRPLVDNKKSIKKHGIRDGDVVILQHMSSTGSSHTNFTSPDQEDFAAMLRQQMAERERRQEQRLRMMNAHPFDTEAQRMIAEEIRQKNIEANMEAAMEYNPETFGTVVMLYINCKVNGYQVKAFVDSGAQTTIMSAACAERVNIMRLVDTRWSGLAKGVGVQRILGRIHMVQVQIESDFLTTSFSVLKEQPMDMLLGLDMLKRHQCSIDLKKNVLRIGTTGTETQFLAEQDLPDCARLSSINSDDDIAREVEERDMQQAIRDSRLPSPSGNSHAGKRKRQHQYLCLLDDNCYINNLDIAFSSCPQCSSFSTMYLPEFVGHYGATTSGININRLDPALTILPSDKFGETEVKELVSLGFTREQVIAELRHFNGDKKQAIAALFAKSLKF